MRNTQGFPPDPYPSHRYRGGPLPFTKPRAATPLRRPLPASHAQMMFSPLTRIPHPDCPKSPRETEILRTHIQGRKQILDSH